jgi:hypothetical protein
MDPLETLDFDPELACELGAQPYARRGPLNIPLPMPGIPIKGKCPNIATHSVMLRMCPCVSDLRKIRETVDLSTIAIDHGLAVRTAMLCDLHIAYFAKYILYPFLCDGCGVMFEDPTEMITELNSLGATE